MTRQILALALSALLLTPLGVAREREVIRTNWSGLQTHLANRQTKGKTVIVTTSGGDVIKTDLREVRDDGLLVRLNRDSSQWKTSEGLSLIPKEQVRTLGLGGRTGKGRLYGTLAGLGAGAGIGAAIATGSNITEGVMVIIIPVAAAGLAGLGALAGYFIGRSADHPGPEFVLIP